MGCTVAPSNLGWRHDAHQRLPKIWDASMLPNSRGNQIPTKIHRWHLPYAHVCKLHIHIYMLFIYMYIHEKLGLHWSTLRWKQTNKRKVYPFQWLNMFYLTRNQGHFIWSLFLIELLKVWTPWARLQRWIHKMSKTRAAPTATKELSFQPMLLQL